MRKTRMISVIAASMLTATVVFTGCGGGGSSTTVSSAPETSSSAPATSSSAPASSSSVPASSSSAAGGEAPCLPGQPCETESSSSSVAPQIKTVKVSDGWVLGATVKCKNDDGSDVVTAVSTDVPGAYELWQKLSCPLR